MSTLSTLVTGLVVAALVVAGAAWTLRSFRRSISGEKSEYTGAMGSAAMEAMMAEARRQRELLNQRENPDSDETG